MKIIYFVRSLPPYWSNRIDVDHIIKTLIKEGHQITVFDIKQRMLLNCNEDIREYYVENLKCFDKTPLYLLINFIVFVWFLLKNKGKYDVAHIFYVREEHLILQRLLKGFASKLYLTIYGSDFNIKNFIKKKFKKLYVVADIITVTNEGMVEQIVNENSELQFKNSIKVLMLPQVRFNQYENFHWEDKELAKKKLGFSKYNKVIIVGTSAVNYEQHSEIIDELSQNETKNLLFVFPLTYGTGNFRVYRSKIKDYAIKKITNNDIMILTEYLAENELADLRIASDILINLRKNDQLVASMLESFLVGAEVIAGSWLPYRVLSNLGVSFESIDKISDINRVLLEIVNLNFDNRKNKLEKNREIISTEYSFESDLLKWMEYYN